MIGKERESGEGFGDNHTLKKQRGEEEEDPNRDISPFVSHYTECYGTDNTHACTRFREFNIPSTPSNFMLTKFHKLNPEILQSEYMMQIKYVDLHSLYNPKLRIYFHYINYLLVETKGCHLVTWLMVLKGHWIEKHLRKQQLLDFGV